jgi:hypothetical protein
MGELRSRAAASFGAVSWALGLGLACSGGSMTSASATASTSTSEVMSTTGADSASTTSAGASTGATSTGATSSTSAATETGCSFLGCETSDSGCDAAPGLEGVVRCTLDCDVWLQDCPEGAKCTLWANDGGSQHNARRCVPVDAEPQAPGEPCVVTGDLYSGVDNCELGALCWYLDSDTQEGECVGLCDGSPESPTCAEPGTVCALKGDRLAVLCLPTCDPLAQDCAEGRLCLPALDSFVCEVDGWSGAGAYGDPCEYANACDPGLVCLSPEYVPDCMAGGCCSPFCETTAPNTCPGDGQACIPWFEEGQAPEGYESVGVCGIPQ